MKNIQFLESQYRKMLIGEMVDSVAHQWTQPISTISLYVKMLEDDFKYGEVNKEYLQHLNEKVDNQINFMLETLETFRSFLQPKTKSEKFDIIDSVEMALSILQDVLKSNQIKIFVYFNNPENPVFGSKVELANLIINLINNSKDAFIENNILNREISVKISRSKFTIKDNAGGIPKKIIKKIFKSNFTTKQSGSGVGLYLSKKIVEKLNGKIKVKTKKSGTTFTIKFLK